MPAHAQEAAAGREPGDILVTAQRVEERLQDVPITISVLDGEALAERGIRSMAGLRGQVPNLYIEPSLGQQTTTSIYLRGLGQINPSFFYDAPVAIYVDGVYYARATGALIDLFDLERVEVLRGPQGTLFGRNASAGALSIVTRRPDAGGAAAALELGGGTQNQFNMNGMVNLPLIADRLAVRGALQVRTNRGYQQDLFSDERAYSDDILSGRIALGFVASERLTVTLRGDYMQDRGENPRPERLGSFGPDRYESNFSADEQFNNVTTWGLSGTVEADLGDLRLQSITAYRDVWNRNRAEGDGRQATVGVFENLGQSLDNWSFSQELTLLGDRLFGLDARWQTGLFYFREQNEFSGSLLILPFPPFAPANTQVWSQKTNALGLFGQVTVPIGERVEVTGGLRYTWDKKLVSARQILDATGQLDPNFVFDGEIRENKPTWRASASYALSDAVTLYFNSGTGFRAGNFNGGARTVEAITAFALPTETVFLAEGGAKTSLLDRRLTLNANYYYQKVKNLQLEVLTSEGVSQRNLTVGLNGLEAEVNFALSDRFSLYGHVASIFDKPEQIPGSLATTLPRAPKWSGQMGGSYGLPLAGGRLEIGGNARFTSRYNNTDTGTPELQQPGFTTVDAFLQLSTAGDRYYLRAEGINLTDTRYLVSGFFIPGLVDVETRSLPRRFLVTVGGRW